MNEISQWFGEDFKLLHPLIQQIHLNDSTLEGMVNLEFGKGLAGFIGKRLAKKLGVPDKKGFHTFQVNIYHKGNKIYWNRTFNQFLIMQSVFTAIGNKTNGYFIEETGFVKMKLNVEIIDQGWYWKCLEYKIMGISLPQWIFPKSSAYKRIINDKYEFYVGFNFPFIGKLLSYQGLLKKV